MSSTSHSSSLVMIFSEGLSENFPYWVFSCVAREGEHGKWGASSSVVVVLAGS